MITKTPQGKKERKQVAGYSRTQKVRLLKSLRGFLRPLNLSYREYMKSVWRYYLENGYMGYSD